MHQIKSKDGTPIAFWVSGQGAPLVLVHGTTADHTRWAPILDELEKHFTVHAIDRRGRGHSGDSPDHSLEREFDDVASVVDAIGRPVDLLGHSYGALCSLEASLRTPNVRRLVLYEPPIPTGIPIYPPQIVERLQALVDAGDRDAVVTAFFREVVRMPDSELVMLRSLSNWAARVAAAHTIPREMRAADAYEFDDARFAAMSTPTLMLVGGDSPPFLKRATEVVAGALSSSQMVVMAGQQHTAMNTAPDLFLREVLSFLAP
jgi:pimeloyl-ACP methyl ester carboxylesterase